jgi:tetratricopeptide (TPR) repeat protein
LTPPNAGGHTRTTLELLVTRATVLSLHGRLKEAAATLIGAGQLAAAEGYVDIETRALINLGFATAADDPRMGLKASREGAEIALRMGLRSYLTYLVGNAIENGLQTGDWDDIEALLDRALAVELGDDAATHLHSGKAVLAAMRGEPYRDALDQLNNMRNLDDPQARAGTAETEARISLAEGRYDHALERMRAAAAEFRQGGGITLATIGGRAALWAGNATPPADILQWMEGAPGRVMAAIRVELSAGVAALSGDRSSAVAGFVDAVHRWRELEVDFERALCQVTLVATLGPGPDTVEAAAEARKTFEKLRAQPFIDRLDEMLARRAGGATPRAGSRSAAEQISRT